MIQPSSEAAITPASPHEVGPNWQNLEILPGPTSTDEQFAYLEGYASGQKAAHFLMGEALADKDAQIEEMREQSLIDPLTGIGNRRRMEKTYHGLVTQHPLRRHDETRPAFTARHTAIMIDLDNFRDINTAEGHAGGDMVLKAVAEAIDGLVRDRDEFARIGGDELALILPRTTLDKGLEIAEEIRLALDNLRIGPKELRMTASIGVADLVHAETLEDGLKPADDAAYAAKSAGRNRVVQYDLSLPHKQP